MLNHSHKKKSSLEIRAVSITCTGMAHVSMTHVLIRFFNVDIDPALLVIYADIFENEVDFDSEVKVLIVHIPTEQVQSENTCGYCNNVYITKRNLTRSINIKVARSNC